MRRRKATHRSYAVARERTRGRWRSVISAFAVGMMGAAAFVGLGAAAPAVAEDAPNQLCSYASEGTGQYADTICWLDLGALNTIDAASPSGQNFSFNIGGEYTLSFNLKSSGNREIYSAAFPTYAQAYLGNNSNYSGVSGRPAILTTDGDLSAGNTTITQSNITMTDSAGRAVTGWSLVGADAESTDGDGPSREFDQWNSSAPIRSLTNQPDGSNGLGNACAGGFTGVGTTTVTCTGGSDPDIGVKTGTAIIASDTPTTFSQVMHVTPGTNQGVAFGVLVSKLTLDKTVDGRVAPEDSFDTRISSANGTTVETATTGSANSSTTGKQTVLPLSAEGAYTLSEAPSEGSTTLDLYGQQWSCTNVAAVSSTTLPTGAGITKTVVPAPGDDITCVITNTPASYTVQKTSSAQKTTAGSGVTYTVTVANTGPVSYTAANPASFTDDMSAVLDDAVFNGATVQSSDGSSPGSVAYNAPTLSWSGPLAVGSTVTVTYTVTVNNPDTGDHILTNSVVPTGPGGACIPAESCVTETPVQSITFTKVANTDKVVPGSVVTYTISATNTGQVAYTTGDNAASFMDDLTNVLDDATYNGDARATTGTSSYDQPTLSWSGPVDVGQTVTVTYSVTVNDPDRGDKILRNAVVSEVPGSDCPPNSTRPECNTEIPSGSYTVKKVASRDSAPQGSTVTYTVTVTNTGEVAYTDTFPASFQDDLTQVLDDADYNADAKATAGTTSYQAPYLTWSGALPVDGAVTVTYSVYVKSPDNGDRTLINAVVPTGPGGDCATADGCTTNTPVPPGIYVHTGGGSANEASSWWGACSVLGLFALVGCAGIMLRRRFQRP